MLTTSYVYNGFGEQVSQSSPDTGASSSPRDAGGNVDAATDARNKTADYTHDALNRVSEIAHADETVALGYDAGANGRGRLTSMTDSAGSTIWSYDAVGRTIERSQSTGSVTLEVGYGYDLYGRLGTLTTPSGQALTYEYTNGRVSGLKVNGAWILNQVAYQPFGPLNSWNWGNGTSTTRSYDTDGQLTQVASAGTSNYAFFLDGQISSRSDDFTVSLPSTAGTATLAVLTSSNRLQNATGAINRTYGYDAAGNTTSDGARTFTYNDAGRMKTSTGTSGTTTYTYNGLGERVKKANASTTYFAYDEAGHLLGEYDAAGDLIQETVWLGDIPVAVLKPNGGGGIDVFYVHTDHLNTPRRITRPSDNAIVWRWDSDPFGVTAANEDADGDTVAFAYHLRFPGQYFDAETELHYNYFRDYDAVTGRYIQSDPIGLAGGANTYAYAAGNPSGFFDPFGLDIYRGAGNYYSDIAPSGQCERAVFSGGYIVAWVECDQAASDRAAGADACQDEEPAPRYLSNGPIVDPGFDWKAFGWELVRPDWTIVLGAVGKGGKFWKGLRAYRSAVRTNGLSGRARRYYQWDHTHGDVEVYDRYGRHLGTADPETGLMIKAPVEGRTIEL